MTSKGLFLLKALTVIFVR